MKSKSKKAMRSSPRPLYCVLYVSRLKPHITDRNLRTRRSGNNDCKYWSYLGRNSCCLLGMEKDGVKMIRFYFWGYKEYFDSDDLVNDTIKNLTENKYKVIKTVMY